MMLSRSRYDRESVEHAHQAVRMSDTDIRARLEATTEAFPQHQLDEAKGLLQWAQADVAALPSDFDEAEESGMADEDSVTDFEEDEARVHGRDGDSDETADREAGVSVEGPKKRPVGLSLRRTR